ncbi:MAG: hypothetical protein IT459_20090 [Planctomycetes bacterium]|nr:hypothetical protein [Planctomycetota bacterium]
MTYKDANGVNKSFECCTGQFGSNHTADDIAKGATAATKASKIADAINYSSANGGNVTATASGSTVTVSVAANSGNRGVTKVIKSNNTGEGVNSLGLVDDDGTQLIATVTFAGAIAGVDDNDVASTLVVGTDRATSAISPGDYDTVEEMVDAIVESLVDDGVAASAISRNCIQLTMSQSLDVRVHFGTTDVGIRQDAEIRFRND